MSEQSLQGLIDRLQGRSITHGWDAVVSMNRAKVNQLLEQQYVTQFNQDSFLKRIHGSVELDVDGKQVLELTGLLLGKPLLSFENASLQGSRARLTMNVVSGMVALRNPGGRIDPPRILSSYAVTEQHGFSVLMDIDLDAVMGSVDQHGEVVLDLAHASNFSSDLVSGDLEQMALGDFFAERFKRLPESSRVYRLGMLDFDPDDRLAPRNFMVRTQAAPGGRDASSANYREGAVVLFVRTRANDQNGSEPGSDFPYLIPDDVDASTGKYLFSGSLFLASRVTFDWFILQGVEAALGRDLAMESLGDSAFVSRSLVARSGAYALGDIDMKHAAGGSAWTVSNNEELRIAFDKDDSSSEPLQVSVVGDGLLKCTWRGSNTFSFHFSEFHTLVGDREEDADVRFSHELEFHLKAAVDPQTSVVSFEALPGAVRKSSVVKINGDIGLYYTFHNAFERRVADMMDAMFDDLQYMQLRDIDLFALNHLLFPEQNALLLTHAALPGDLALFGHIDPRYTAFAIEPTFVNVEAGAQQAFQLLETRFKDLAASVTWSVRGIDGTRSQGEIDQQGRFTAPPRERMEGQAVRNVVTASVVDPDSGETFSASALVVIVAQPMALVPSMATLDMNNLRTITLKGSTLTGTALTWKLVSGPGKVEGKGEEATYTPPATIEKGIDSALIEAEDAAGNTIRATVLLLKDDFVMKVAPDFHPGLPPGAVLQLRLNGTQVPEGMPVVWSVSAGEGSVDPDSGKFTAPERITMPYSVVQVSVDDGFETWNGYSVVYQSEYASEARWHELSVFDLHADSSTKLFYNGMQQVSVRIEVMPSDVDGEEVEVSDAELNSIQLVDALTLQVLPEVDAAGVPEGESWAFNQHRNAFDFYPEALVARQPEDKARRVRHLYVQTRSDRELKIGASLVRDDLVTFYSAPKGDESPPRIIVPDPVPPLKFDKDSFKFEAVRVAGGEDNDYEMETCDYYTLLLSQGGETIRFREIVFEERSGTVQWESRQYEEDVASFTGYALHKDTELRFDPGLRAHLLEGKVEYDTAIPAGRGCPEGALLISLFRVQKWRFDLICEQGFAKPLLVKVLDQFGNEHHLRINFASPTDRHALRVDVL